MNKKIITLIITGLISTSFMGQTYVSAAEIKKTTVQDEYSKEMSINDAINIVENNYLIQNDNGTFSIDETAKSIIGDNLFLELEKGMNQVNELIGDDLLQVDKNGQVTESNYESQNLISSRITDAYGRVLSSYSYCSGYQWYWWGFKTNVSKSGSDILSSEITKTIAAVALTGGAAALVPGFVVPAGIVGLAVEAWLVSLQVECEKGTKSNGIAVTALGAPSSPQITDINARY